MNTQRRAIGMSRPAMLAYTLLLLKSLKLRGIKVSKPRKLLWAAIRRRWREGPDLFVAYANQGRSVGVRFQATTDWVGADLTLASLRRVGMTDANAASFLANLVH